MMMGTHRRLQALVTLVVVLGLTGAVFAGFRVFDGPAFEPATRNIPYDGRFTFARLKYTTGPGGYYYCGLPAWAHGYVSCAGGSRAEESLMKIMKELSYLNPHEDSVVLTVDDPELAKYPVAYMTEAGFWTLNDQEAAAFRAYLQKGGFAIFDDFRDPPRGGGGWENFEENMRRVIPGAQFVDLDPSQAIFKTFFAIESFDIIPQSYDQGRVVIRGLFEDNDPRKRLMAIANFNTDISDFWEFSATGFRPIDESNEAYKLGVNYIMYGMMH
jgi:uncharacterized protein DUF4159